MFWKGKGCRGVLQRRLEKRWREERHRLIELFVVVDKIFIEVVDKILRKIFDKISNIKISKHISTH